MMMIIVLMITWSPTAILDTESLVQQLLDRGHRGRQIPDSAKLLKHRPAGREMALVKNEKKNWNLIPDTALLP